jgi:hypothetical protein
MSEAEENIGPAARERSTVEFPYADLDEGVSIVRIIHQSGGVPMARDQIAARMDQKATSGAFITKISAARMFGLVDVLPGAGKIQVTALGHEVIAPDEGRQRDAKAQAFLNVELYRKLYDEFRNRHLPPRPHGLEQALVAMGVAVKQRTNARYAFDRSAKQAGFFEHGMDRLVAPVGFAARVETTPAGIPSLSEAAFTGHTEAPQRELDGVITALIDKLPIKGPWPTEKRVAWLKMMAMAFDMAYGNEPNGLTIGEAKITPPSGPVPEHLHGSPLGVKREPTTASDRSGGFSSRNPADLDDEIPF